MARGIAITSKPARTPAAHHGRHTALTRRHQVAPEATVAALVVARAKRVHGAGVVCVVARVIAEEELFRGTFASRGPNNALLLGARLGGRVTAHALSGVDRGACTHAHTQTTTSAWLSVFGQQP